MIRRPCRAAERIAALAVVALGGVAVRRSVRQPSTSPACSQRAGERVSEYFARAQSIMCLEKVSLQRLGMGFGADGPARRVESELRLSWEPSPENPTPTEAQDAAPGAARQRQRRRARRTTRTAPRRSSRTRKSSRCRCCCRSQRAKYTFTHSGRETIDGRDAIVIAFREIRKPTVDVSLVEDNEDCISFDIEGGMRGRIWIDAETHDVLRLDRSLSGLVEIPLPQESHARAAAACPGRWSGGIRRFASSASRSRIRRKRWCCRSQSSHTADHPRRRHAAPSHLHAIPVLPPVHHRRPRRSAAVTGLTPSHTSISMQFLRTGH